MLMKGLEMEALFGILHHKNASHDLLLLIRTSVAVPSNLTVVSDPNVWDPTNEAKVN